MSPTSACLSNEMKEAMVSDDRAMAYRIERISHIQDAACRYGVVIENQDVLDFGCGSGLYSVEYLRLGAKTVTGVDILQKSLDMALARSKDPRLSFILSSKDHIPLKDQSIDVVISYDVFEHVSHLDLILEELYRILRAGGKVLIGTWGWYHPFAPHLFSAMPVPWAHVMFGERALLQACRRVYHSAWYVPTMFDLDADGRKKPDKYTEESISTDYVNKLLIRDFERTFKRSRFTYQTFLMPFGSRWARWTRVLLRVPWAREFVAGYVWFVLTKS